MLGLFREKIVSWGAKIMFALLILSFGMWGIGDYIGVGGLGGGGTTAAKVGGSEISVVELQNEVIDQTNRLRSLLGENATPERLRELGIASSALERLIQRRVMLEGARDLGLVADDDTIRGYIASDPRFAGIGGTFDRAQYARSLRSEGLNERNFENRVRGQLVQRQFLSTVEFGGDAPDALVNAVFAYRNERRVAEVLRLEHAAIAGLPEPTEADLARFHEDNARRFTAPEYRKITLVRMRAADLAPEIAVGEDRLKAEYDNRLGEFTTPEQRHVRQFLLQDEDAATAAVGRIRAGEDFLAVAKELAGIDENTADLGTVTVRGIALRPLGRAAFGLSAPGIADPVQTDLGWHVVQVLQIAPETRTDFAAARDRLLADVRHELAVDALADLGNRFEDSLGGGATLEEAARRLNLTPVTIEAVDLVGRDRSGAPAAGLPEDAGGVLDIAFQSSEGESSPLTEIGIEEYFILRLDAIVPPAVRPLETVRAEIAAAWKAERQAEIAEKKSAEMVAKVKGGAALEDVAKEFGAALYVSKEFLRTGEGLEKILPASLIVDLFKIRRGETVAASGNDAEFVARLKDIAGPEAGAAEGGALNALRRELDAGIANDLAEQLYAALRRRVGVEIDRTALERAY